MAAQHTIQLKRRLSTATSNPQLAEGERIEEFDTGRAKVGPPGGASWNTVPYQDELIQSRRNIWQLDPAYTSSGYTPAQRTTYIQSILAGIAAAGVTAATIEVSAHYVVGRTGVANTFDGELLFPSPAGCLVTWDMHGGGHLELDPATTASSVRCTIIGPTIDGSASPGVRVRGGVITTNKAVIGGGSIFPVADRRNSTDTSQVGDVDVRDTVFNDVQIAVSLARNTALTDLAGPNRKTTISDVTINGALNRAIELTQVYTATIRDCQAWNAASCLNLLSYARGVNVRGLRGTYITSGGGIYIGFSSSGIRIAECDIDGAVGASGASGAVEFHSEPANATYITEDVRFRDNEWGYFPAGSVHRSLTFMANTTINASQNITWRKLRWLRDHFKGDVQLFPIVTGAGTPVVDMNDLRWTDCVFDGAVTQVVSNPAATNLHDYWFTRCTFHGAADIKANRGTYTDCQWDTTPVIDPAAKSVVLVNPITPTAISTAGLDASVQIINPIVRA